MSEQPVLVIYHAHCADGFTAAYVCHGANYGNVELFPASYGDEPPDVTGRNVEIVDFSYPREDLIRMHEQAASLVVLDHHKSAQAACEGLDFCVFDMEQSGAGLAWSHHHPEVDAITLVRYIEDRDIWRWALPASKAISAYISTIKKTLENWDTLATNLETNQGMCVQSGMAVLRHPAGRGGNTLDHALLVYRRRAAAQGVHRLCAATHGQAVLAASAGVRVRSSGE